MRALVTRLGVTHELFASPLNHNPLNAQDRVAYVFLLTSLLSSAACFPALGFFDPARTSSRLRRAYPAYLFGLYALFMIFLFCAEAGALGGFLL